MYDYQHFKKAAIKNFKKLRRKDVKYEKSRERESIYKAQCLSSKSSETREKEQPMR